MESSNTESTDTTRSSHNSTPSEEVSVETVPKNPNSEHQTQNDTVSSANSLQEAKDGTDHHHQEETAESRQSESQQPAVLEGASGGAEATPESQSTVTYTDLLEACGGSDGTVQKSVAEFLGKAVEGQDLKSLELHAVTPLTWCPHLKEVRRLPSDRPLEVTDPCLECGHVGENWVCLTCYEVHCSRYINEHMLYHGIETEHRMVLSYADLSVWCYACDQYVHHEDVFKAKDAVHLSKFGVESSEK